MSERAARRQPLQCVEGKPQAQQVPPAAAEQLPSLSPRSRKGVAAVIEAYDWQRLGACVGMDLTVFYHPDGEKGRARTKRINEAKKVCEPCPVIEQCRTFALDTKEPYGVWGGLSENEREQIHSGSGKITA